jgi:hypothetical protein
MIDEKDVINVLILHMRAVIDIVDSHKVDPEDMLELLQDEVANADTDWQSDFWTALIRYIHDEDYSSVKH